MKFQHFIFLFFLMLTFSSVNAQDIIIEKNGDEIKAKVVEVGTTEIKYVKFETLETSPVYSILKSEVFMIKYADGSKDVFNTETQNNPVPVQQNNTEIPVQQNNNQTPVQNTKFSSYNKFNKNTPFSNHTTIGQSKIVIGTGFSLRNTYKRGKC